jgi:hypothetical protein
MRLVRIDDFPHGDKRMFLSGDHYQYRQKVRHALGIFEREGVPYILGASPLLFQQGDIEFLNSVVKEGKVVLHGFTHGWERPWERITSFWRSGGEFADLLIENISERYHKSLEIMNQVDSFSEEDFIAPFNCYNQTLLDFLKDTPVKRLHTSDEFWEPYGLDKMEYHSIVPIVSKFKVTYGDVDEVIKNLHDPSQITLHWCYDAQKKDWLLNYQLLCDKIIEGEESK